MDPLQPIVIGETRIEPVSPIDEPIEVTNEAGETVTVTPLDLAMAVAKQLTEAPADTTSDLTARFKITHRLTAAVASLDDADRE